MICSFVQRLRFILWSSHWARASFGLDQRSGARSAHLSFPAMVSRVRHPKRFYHVS